MRQTTTPKDKMKIRFDRNSIAMSTSHKNSLIPEENETEKEQEAISINRLSYEEPSMKRSSVMKVNKKFTQFVNSLNETIEQYQNDFLTCYGTDVFSTIVAKYREKLNTFYQKKIENFENFEDQIKELNMLLDGNEANEANNTINLMIENLIIEKNQIEDEMQAKHEKEIQELIEEESKKNYIQNNEKFIKLHNALKSNVQEIVINNEKNN